MKRFFLLTMLALSVMAMGLPAPTHAAQVYRVQFSGRDASATFDMTDSSGCITTSWSVHAVDGLAKEAGKPEVASQASLFIFQYDRCTDTYLKGGSGSSPLGDTAFQIDQKLSRATVNTTIQVDDFFSNTIYPVELSVSWTGIGDTVRQKDSHQIWTRGYIFNLRSDGTVRPAEAAGTLRIGGVEILTPEPTLSAQMESSKSGEIEVSY